MIRARTLAVLSMTAAALTGTLVGASQSQASNADPVDVGIQAVEYIPGKDTQMIGDCKGWLNKRTEDGYVQAVGQSWGNECDMWLERKRYKSDGSLEYNWKSVSSVYTFRNSWAKTGFHWNGAKAGSRVCVYNRLTGFGDCGEAAW